MIIPQAAQTKLAADIESTPEPKPHGTEVSAARTRMQLVGLRAALVSAHLDDMMRSEDGHT